MTNTPTPNPFIIVDPRGGHSRRGPDKTVDLDKFAFALGAALAQEGIHCRAVPFADALPKWRSAIEITDNPEETAAHRANGLRLFIETASPSPIHKGRVTISVQVADVHRDDQPIYFTISSTEDGKYKLPVASLSVDRPLNTLARTVVRKVIEPAVEPATAIRDYARARDENRGSLDQIITTIETEFPGLLRIKKTDDGLAARADTDSRIRDYFYMNGRLDPRGFYKVDRIQEMSPAFFRDFLELIRRHYPVEQSDPPVN